MARQAGLHAQQLLHQHVLQAQFDPAPCPVHQPGAGDAQAGFEQHGDASADGQHPQGRDGLVRDDAVIDLQGEQRDGHGQQVGDKRAEGDFTNHAAETAKFGPEPVTRLGLDRVAAVQLGGGHDGVDDAAGEMFDEFGQRDLLPVIGGGGVVQDDGVAGLFQHKDQRVIGQAGDGRPVGDLRRQRGARAGTQARVIQRGDQRIHGQARAGVVNLAVQNIGGFQIDTQQSGVGRHNGGAQLCCAVIAARCGDNRGCGRGQIDRLCRHGRGGQIGGGVGCSLTAVAGQLAPPDSGHVKRQHGSGHILSPSTSTPLRAAILSSTRATSKGKAAASRRRRTALSNTLTTSLTSRCPARCCSAKLR